VIAGVAQVVQRPTPDAPGPRDAVALMIDAARAAAPSALLRRIEDVLIPEGTWSPSNPASAVAAALGCERARTTIARIGVLQTTVLARAAAAIAAGEVDVALVVGGEAKASDRFGLPTHSPAEAPDVDLRPDGDIVTALEIERGLAVPAQSYAVQEDAVARRLGDRLDELWAGFAAVAATNPYAWDPDPRNGDRVVSTPYRKRHCSQWNVDMAVAIVLCSTAAADDAGVPLDGRVHPLAVVESQAMIPVSRRAELHRSPQVAAVGAELARRTGTAPCDADHLELYSCFPSAVRIQAEELGIDLRRQLTVTGGMAYAGGPLNSAALHGVATMVDVLRGDPGTVGVVTAISGMLTKHGAVALSTTPPADGFAVGDVTAETLATTATVDVDPDATEVAEVEGMTTSDVTVVVGRDRRGNRIVNVEAAAAPARR
jgi:acetyl-CoA C-acetyltransferase